MRRTVGRRVRRLHAHFVTERAHFVCGQCKRYHVKTVVKTGRFALQQLVVAIQPHISVGARRRLPALGCARIGANEHAYLFLLVDIGIRRCVRAVYLHLARVLRNVVVEIHRVYIHAVVLQRTDDLYDIVGGHRFHAVGDHHNALYHVVVKQIARIANGRADVGGASVHARHGSHVGHFVTHVGHRFVIAPETDNAHFGVFGQFIRHLLYLFLHVVEVVFGRIGNVRHHVHLGFGDHFFIRHAAHGQSKAHNDQQMDNERRYVMPVAVVFSHRDKIRHEHGRKERHRQQKQPRVIEVDIAHSSTPPSPPTKARQWL